MAENTTLVKLKAVANASGRNRKQKRRILAQLRIEERHILAPDRAKEVRAKRQSKRQAANKTRNKNRRLAKR